jgi:hypothetical protein
MAVFQTIGKGLLSHPGVEDLPLKLVDSGVLSVSGRQHPRVRHGASHY